MDSKGFFLIVLSFLLGTFSHTSTAQQTIKVDWDEMPWTPTNMTASYIVEGVSVDVNVEDSTNSLVNATPVIFSFYQGDQPQPVNALLFASSLPVLGTTDQVRIVINLGDMGTGVEQVNFKLFDVDGEVDNFERREQVTVSGALDGNTVMPMVITGNVDVHDIQSNVIYGNLPVDPIGGNSATGVVEVSFAEAIDTLVIDFAIEEGAMINPNSTPGFGLYDIHFMRRPGDLYADINNCVRGVSPDDTLVYTVNASNIGFETITGANLTTAFPATATNITWECVSGSCPVQNGSGELNETIDLEANTSITYLISAELTGATLFEQFNPSVQITPPLDTPEASSANNDGHDNDLVYPFVFKNSFECMPPGA